MIEWIKNLFRPKSEPIKVIGDDGRLEEDQLLIRVLQLTMETGRPHIGVRNDDGTFRIEEVSKDDREGLSS